jgi:hypothetical protein
MSTIDLGAPVKSVWAGAPIGGTLAVSLTRPDGTNFTPPAIVTTPETSVTFTPDMAGRWLIRWTSTGAAVGAYADIANVWPVDPLFIISIDDAREGLSMPTNTDPATLSDLRLYVAAATPVIEDIVGPTVKRSVTQRVPQGWSFASLWYEPVSITSVMFGATPMVLTDEYTVSLNSGIVYFNSPTPGDVDITYVVGSTTISPNVQLATRELVRHWWQIGRQGTRPAVVNLPNSADAWTPSGFAVPRRVIELCAPDKTAGGFA